MRKLTRILLIASLAFAAAIIAGCGGGGGGGSSQPPPSGFTLSGTIRDVNTNTPVSGAVVTIGLYTSTSNSQGQVSFNMTSAPTVTTYSVNLTNTTPRVYTWWIKANTIAQDPASVGLPSNLTSGGTLGTIYAAAITVGGQDYAPPPPIIN